MQPALLRRLTFLSFFAIGVIRCHRGPSAESTVQGPQELQQSASLTQPDDAIDLLKAKHHLFLGPEPDGVGYVREVFSDEELRLLHLQIDRTEAYINNHLSQGDHGMAWLAGYFRLQSSLPALRHALLTERHSHDWQGLKDHDRSGPAHAAQYTHHLAYIAAIEEITGQPVAEFVSLTKHEVAALRDDMLLRVNPTSAESSRARCAKWLLEVLWYASLR